jgi:hypothetical protein
MCVKGRPAHENKDPWSFNETLPSVCVVQKGFKHIPSVYRETCPIISAPKEGPKIYLLEFPCNLRFEHMYSFKH